MVAQQKSLSNKQVYISAIQLTSILLMRPSRVIVTGHGPSTMPKARGSSASQDQDSQEKNPESYVVPEGSVKSA
jgi:hypothetical protein